jgi:hypothetical protein
LSLCGGWCVCVCVDAAPGCVTGPARMRVPKWAMMMLMMQKRIRHE